MHSRSPKVADEIGSTLGVVARWFRLFSLERVSRKLRSYAERRRKWSTKRRTAHPGVDRYPVFVMGSNRSGTQMVCRAIGNHPNGWDYPEGNSIAFKNYHLRSDALVSRLIRRAPAPVVAFGNILDSQSIERLLQRFDGARALWVYRRYEDAANSSVRKWGSHFKDLSRHVAGGELRELGPRGENIRDETVQLFAEIFREDLTDEDGSCLYWYVRNRLYFDLALPDDPRVLLVKYEDCVRYKEAAFRRICDFLLIPYDPAIHADVFDSSVSKHPWPGCDPRIRDICEELRQRLDASYADAAGDVAAAESGA